MPPRFPPHAGGVRQSDRPPQRHRSALAPLALTGAALASLVLSAHIAVALAIANAVLLAAIGAVQLAAVLTARRAELPRGAAVGPPPFVTIHVPCCNEPPGVVIRTLESLAALDWTDYEVICLDNNTTDRALWTPVRDRCARLGPRFRFHHVENLAGAKAGALNLALELSSPRATHVAVIDADYQVSPRFLRRAWSHLADPEVAQVQFPQAYRNGSRDREGLTGEFAHYFDVFMPTAERLGAPLLTGTMSVIRRDALEAVGRWRDCTITEDAELGARLAVAGLRGHYVPEVMGRGVMPTELDSLRSQRRRWVHGNADTLFRLRPRDWLRLGARRGFGVLAQLTAWFNFLLIPVAILTVVGVLGLESPGHRLAAAVAALTVVAQLALRGAVLALAPRAIGEPRPTLRSFAAHLGLAWEGATGWIESLLGVRLGFARTRKYLGSESLRHALPALASAGALGLAALGLLWTGQLLAAVGALGGAAAFAAVISLQRQLDAIARRAAAPAGGGPQPATGSIPATPMEKEKA